MARSGAHGGTTLGVIVPLPPASAVAFVDGQHGWAGGAGGLLGTSDGRTFRVEVRAPIIGISAFDRARAWALTGDGFVLHTSDGRHWSRLGAPHLFRVQFVDARVGFGLTRDGVLVVSGDAGRSWVQARAPGLVQSECFTTRRDGWRSGPQELPDVGCRAGDAWVVFHEGAAAGTEGYRVFRSLGGGRWRAVLASPFQRKLPAISNYAGAFTVVGHGTAVFTGNCAPCAGLATATVVRTVDGGSSFTRTALGGPAPSAVSFLDARRGWLVAGRQLEGTNDGGRHWRAVVRLP